MRLRRVTVGAERVHKLTQKIRLVANDPAEVATTNIYLEPHEYQAMLLLPAAVLVKTRYAQEAGFVIDEFHGPLHGLWLAEIEVVDLQAPLRLPAWLGQDVTHEERYSGGALARQNPKIR